MFKQGWQLHERLEIYSKEKLLIEDCQHNDVKNVKRELKYY